jgi:hypothetical protein
MSTSHEKPLRRRGGQQRVQRLEVRGGRRLAARRGVEHAMDRLARLDRPLELASGERPRFLGDVSRRPRGEVLG